MPNPFRSTTKAVTTKGNPFRTSTADTAIQDSAVSPLLGEQPLAVERETLPLGPRRSKPLPAVVTTAEAPGPTKTERAAAIASGILDMPSSVVTQTLARFAGVGASEETKRQYQQYVEQAKSAFGPQGRGRRTYEATRDIASLPGEIAKYAGVAMIPGVGLPLAATLGAAEAAGGLKEESSAALAQMLAEKSGSPRLARALGAINETGVGRAAFDVGLGEAVALGLRGGTSLYRSLRSPSIADAFSLGAREGAGEAASAAEPSLASFGSSSTALTVPPRRIQAGPVGSTGGPFFQPMAPERPLLPTGPSRPTRIPALGQALPPEGLATSATPEDVSRFLRKPTKPRIARALEREQQYADEVAGLTPERTAMQQALADAEEARRIGTEPPPGFEDIPATKLDEMLYPDDTVRLKDSESRNLELVEREAGQPRVPRSPQSLAKLSVRQIQSMRNRALMRIEDATADEEWFNTFGLEIAEAGGSVGGSFNKFNKYNEKVIDQGKLKVSPARLRADGAYTEDELGYAMDRFGLDPAQYHDQVVRARSAANRSNTARSDLDRLDAELARRGYEPSALENRPGAVDPRVLTQVATTGLGALGGGAAGAQSEDLGATPMERALRGAAIGATVGAGAGYGASRLMRRGVDKVISDTPALDAVFQTINTGKREVREADRLLTPFQRFRTQVVSETLPLEVAAEKGGGVAARKNVSEAIAAQQGAGQSARQYLEETLGAFLKDMSDRELNQVRSLVKSRRLVDIIDRGGEAKADGTYDQWAKAVAEGEARPRIKAAADAVVELHRNLLDMRRAAGIIDDAEYQRILNSEGAYSPFFREFKDEVMSGTRTLPGSFTKRFSVSSKGIRRMDRTEKAIENTADPLEVAIASVARTFRDTRKQGVMNSLLDMADQGAMPFVRQVQGDPTRPLKANQFQQMRDGKVRLYEVDDPDLFRAMAGQDERTRNIAVKIAQAVKGVKTAGVVLNPAFAAFNVIRDVATSGIQRPDLLTKGLGEAGIGAAAGGTGSVLADDERDAVGMAKNFLRGAGLGAGAGLYARPLAQTLRAVGDIMVGDKDFFRKFGLNDAQYRDFIRQGGSTEGFYVRNPDDAQKVLRELRRTGVKPSDIVNPRSWVDALRFIGSVGEQSTRLAAYRQALDAGKTPLEAVVDAQDRTLRFANVGAGTKTIASMTPFWNAKVQGWDKLARLLKDPKTYAAGATMITAPTIALWSVNKDNPEYWERPQWERNLFWLVPKPEGDGFYRVPKPFEIGYAFGSSFERMLDYAAETGRIPSAAPQSAQAGRSLARSAADMATSTFEGTLPVPEIMSTPMQVFQERDWFRNRDIITRPDLPETMQGTRETSALARALAQTGVSPEITDFAVKSVLGTAGDEGLRLTTAAARALGADLPESDAPTPVLGLFERRFTTQDRGQTEQEIAARDRLRELAKINAGYRETRKTNDREAAITYRMENMAALDLYERLKPLQNKLDDQVAMRRQVERNKTYTQAERKMMLEIIREQTADISRQILEMKDEEP